jgi:calcium-dependent protein kinase
MTSNYQLPYGKKDFILKNSGKFEERYHKIQELGYGGYAKVYRVQNNITKEVFACKELIKSQISDPSKFSKEINILSKCDHPNIIKLYEIYEDSRYFDLIMEQCIGGSLLDKLIEKIDKEGQAYSENEAANIFKQIMLGINYCHSQGIAHRDLKLENILFLSKNKNSTVKIIDFGLSHITKKKLVQYITGKNFENFAMESIVGTPQYISPEVLQGKYNQKCDIWSAGVILYAMLGGHFPFKGVTHNEIYKNIQKINFEFPKDDWKLL